MLKALDVHAYYCIDSLAKFLACNEKPEYRDEDLEGLEEDVVPTALQDLFPNDEYPLFVTWTTDRKHKDELRGCIGNFSPMPLHSGLKEYALISALKDPRFPPIKKAEFANLSCSVSLLVDFEEAKDCYDWKVGTHGIEIKFQDKNGKSYASTYLPEVSEEQGWSKEEAIESLVRKGGYRGDVIEILKDIRLTRYQSHKVKKTYIEYVDYLKG